MAPKRVQKPAAINLNTPSFPTITLGEELFVETNKFLLLNPPANATNNTSPLPSINKATTIHDTTPLSDKEEDKEKAKKLV